jgi:predicted outer membrane protein
MKVSMMLTSVILVLTSTTIARADIASLHGNLSWPESPNVTPTDVKFVLDNSDKVSTELELSELAVKKATRQSVKNFAAQTAEEDRLAQSSLSQIGSTKGIIMPHQQQSSNVNQLSNLPRSLFNTTYIFRLINNQADDLMALETMPQNLAPDLKAWAEQRLETVKRQFGIANSFDSKDLRVGLLGG